MTQEILLSCLVPTIPDRRGEYLPRMLDMLEKQAGNLPVEILSFYDNRRRSVGEKRNSLLREARGKFVVYLDDDDRVADDYIATLLGVIHDNPDADVIVYDQLCSGHGPQPYICKYGIDYKYTKYAVNGVWTGKPAHTMPWRRELVRHVAYQDSNYGEDTDWVKRAVPLVKKQVRIDRVMYYYDFNPKTSRTRSKQPQPLELPGSSNAPTSIYVRDRVPVYASVVMATYNKPVALANTLESLHQQRASFPFEVIVVDDGGSDPLAEQQCLRYQSYGMMVRYYRLDRSNGYRNPGIARNHGYKQAIGDVIIAQSDDVVHGQPNSVELLGQMEQGKFNIATVYNAELDGLRCTKTREMYTGPSNCRPLFFLGSLLRAQVCTIGGNCEEFTEPGYEDDWFGKCLMHGLGLQPVFRSDIVAYHQHHVRPPLREPYARMRELFKSKYEAATNGQAKWTGGPSWPFEQGTSVVALANGYEHPPLAAMQG